MGFSSNLEEACQQTNAGIEAMKPIAEWNEEYILSLPSGEVDWVEFKSSRSLDLTRPGVKEAEVRNELSKQLSAFSNAGGGALVYGVSDPTPGEPLKVSDGGVSLRCKVGAPKNGASPRT